VLFDSPNPDTAKSADPSQGAPIGTSEADKTPAAKLVGVDKVIVRAALIFNFGLNKFDFQVGPTLNFSKMIDQSQQVMTKRPTKSDRAPTPPPPKRTKSRRRKMKNKQLNKVAPPPVKQTGRLDFVLQLYTFIWVSFEHPSKVKCRPAPTTKKRSKKRKKWQRPQIPPNCPKVTT